VAVFSLIFVNKQFFSDRKGMRMLGGAWEGVWRRGLRHFQIGLRSMASPCYEKSQSPSFPNSECRKP